MVKIPFRGFGYDNTSWPTNFFMKLSCADLQWDEFISINGKGKSEKLTSEKRSSMDYFERRNYLNFDPVLLVHQLQYRVEAFIQNHCFKWFIRLN